MQALPSGQILYEKCGFHLGGLLLDSIYGRPAKMGPERAMFVWGEPHRLSLKVTTGNADIEEIPAANDPPPAVAPMSDVALYCDDTNAYVIRCSRPLTSQETWGPCEALSFEIASRTWERSAIQLPMLDAYHHRAWCAIKGDLLFI